MNFLKSILIPALLLTALPGFSKNKTENYNYRLPETTWSESFGNHRAVIKVEKPASVVELDFHWRRPDASIDNTRFLIIDSESGDTIRNIKRLKVDSETCRILFGPVTRPGSYYFYYLPYKVQHGHGNARGGYLPMEEQPEKQWLQLTEKGKIQKAVVEAVESRTAFDSFYPMEVPATAEEQKEYVGSNPASIYAFAEERSFPIRMRNAIPIRWLDQKQGHQFSAEAAPFEYFTFQIGIWNPGDSPMDSISYQATSLVDQKGNQIPASAITCFNLEGVDPYGKEFIKKVDVAPGSVQALWFGVDVAEEQPSGDYLGKITIADKSGGKAIVPIEIKISGEKLADRGDSDPASMTRLRWLNSTLGIADTPIAPYSPVKVSGDSLICSYRSVVIDEETGMPRQIVSFGHEILASPMKFIVCLKDGGEAVLNGKPQVTEATPGHITIGWEASEASIDVCLKATLEFDGRMDYATEILPKKDIEVTDIRLELPVYKNVADYFFGIGLPGQDMPLSYDGKWDVPGMTVNHFGVSMETTERRQWLWPFDSYWIGNAFAGLQMELRGSDYTGPLLNVYRPAYPDSWHNGGKGGFSIATGDDNVTVTAYSGERSLKAGEKLVYEFAFLITPVKEIDMHAQFTDRYYHNGDRPMPSEEELEKGVKIVNVHHGNDVNPFINYPFLTPEKLKEFTDTLHGKDVKVKVYYTLRELSNALPELWAIRSLGDEVYRDGDGGGYNWLREHLVTGYRPQWYVHFEGETPLGITADAAILTSESDSRWYNYYIEGLAWMVKNLGIDGIYLDDVSFDRRILKRMRRAMEQVKPGTLIDLHSNTAFSVGAANQYAEFFPYIDKVWFGESFLYDEMTPANWLVESSGIPFGLTGDMLYRGGNPWLGMQYGMTVRYPWYTEGVNCDPTQIWKIWDDFEIEKSRMYGFWEEDVPVKATDDDVKVTVYRKNDGDLLLSIGNYSDDTKSVDLVFDWQSLGLVPEKVVLIAPEVTDFQPYGEFKADSSLEIAPRKGWLIYVKELE